MNRLRLWLACLKYMKHLVVGYIVHVAAEAADFKLVGVRAAHMEADDLSCGHPQSVRVGMNALDFLLTEQWNRIRSGCGRVLLGTEEVARFDGDDLRRRNCGPCRGQELASRRVDHRLCSLW